MKKIILLYLLSSFLKQSTSYKITPDNKSNIINRSNAISSQNQSQVKCNNKTFKCSSKKYNPFSDWKSRNFVMGKPAIGFGYDIGSLWAIVCKRTANGDVPGKRDKHGKVTYPWGGLEYSCYQWVAVFGQLIHCTAPFPDYCLNRGFQTNDQNQYYNAVIVSSHGMIPGKANHSLTAAWYGWEGKEYMVNDHFYVICE